MNKLHYIAVDFDGTLFENRWPDIGPLIPRAKEVVNRFVDGGGRVIIWTCREDDLKAEAEKALRENEVQYHTINENLPELIERYGNDSRKVGAQMYIDDLGNHGIDWDRIEERLFDDELSG